MIRRNRGCGLPTEISALSFGPGNSWAEEAPGWVFRDNRGRKVPVLPFWGNHRNQRGKVREPLDGSPRVVPDMGMGRSCALSQLPTRYPYMRAASSRSAVHHEEPASSPRVTSQKHQAWDPPSRSACNRSAETKHRRPDPAFNPPTPPSGSGGGTAGALLAAASSAFGPRHAAARSWSRARDTCRWTRSP